ncbi:MAG TPA: hypothetical protein VLJ84_08110 [Usitatibacter sp.]|nr:hypothetical protein [Usitatibacter sp.]
MDHSRPDSLDRLVGTWTTEATHTAMPGVVVHGTAVISVIDLQITYRRR